jgi:hypothetical protein
MWMGPPLERKSTMLNRRTTAVLVASLSAASMAAVAFLGVNPASASAPTAHTTAQATAKSSTTYLATTSGTTTLALNAATAKVLTANGVSVAPASEARSGSTGISFPIRGGLLKAANLHGFITHDGGLTFRAGGKCLTVRDFTISTTKGTLTGYADEAHARITILDLSLAHAKVSAGKKKVLVSNVTATLDGSAAKALNSYFSTKLFTEGLPIGTAKVSAAVTTLRS